MTTTIVTFGGAAQQDHHHHHQNGDCGGKREKIEEIMKKVSMILLCSSPILAKSLDEYVSNSPYADDYRIVLGAFDNIYKIVNEASLELMGRQDACTSMSDVALGVMGLKDCSKHEKLMDGFFTLFVKFFNTNMGNTTIFTTLTKSSGILAVFTCLRDYISTLLTNIMCGLYDGGGRGMVATWVIIKIILKTTASFAIDSTSLIGRVAIAFGYEIFEFFRTQRNRDAATDEYQINNDIPIIEDVIDNIQLIDNKHDIVDRLSAAGDELKSVENNNENGNNIIYDYINDGDFKGDFKDTDYGLNAMKDYLVKAIKDTDPGGRERHIHEKLLMEYNHLAGRWRPATENSDMGPSNLVTNSQPFDQTDYNSDFDGMDTIERSHTFGGIINKRDSEFIKNINKSIEIYQKKHKLNKNQSKMKTNKKAGYNYKRKMKTNKKAGYNNYQRKMKTNKKAVYKYQRKMKTNKKAGYNYQRKMKTNKKAGYNYQRKGTKKQHRKHRYTGSANNW
jgi:hypothetical protein